MNRLALDLRVPVTRIAEIVHERRGITPDTALRLARYFNTSAAFWLNLQTAYDLEVAQDKLSRVIEREVRPAAMAATRFPEIWTAYCSWRRRRDASRQPPVTAVLHDLIPAC